MLRSHQDVLAVQSVVGRDDPTHERDREPVLKIAKHAWRLYKHTIALEYATQHARNWDHTESEISEALEAGVAAGRYWRPGGGDALDHVAKHSARVHCHRDSVERWIRRSHQAGWSSTIIAKAAGQPIAEIKALIEPVTAGDTT